MINKSTLLFYSFFSFFGLPFLCHNLLEHQTASVFLTQLLFAALGLVWQVRGSSRVLSCVEEGRDVASCLVWGHIMPPCDSTVPNLSEGRDAPWSVKIHTILFHLALVNVTIHLHRSTTDSFHRHVFCSCAFCLADALKLCIIPTYNFADVHMK